MAAYDIADLKHEIQRVKMQFVFSPKTAFFSALLAALNIFVTEEHPPSVPKEKYTACVDGISMWLNPAWIVTLTFPQLMGLILHEVMHVAFDHISRCLYHKLDPEIWNIAGDHYINLMILSMGYELPPNGHHDPKYRGWSTQQIYDDLMKNPQQHKKNFSMDIVPAPKNMQEDEHRHLVTANILGAVTQAKMLNQAGSIPGGIEDELQKIINPELPWYTILQNYMQPYAINDYSWSRPNKRYFPEFYLPHPCGERLKQLTFGVDVSGSMSLHDISTIVPEIEYVWEFMKPEQIRLQTFDTRVHLDKLYREGDSLDIVKLKRGGGTNINPLIRSVIEETPEVAIIFTDGYFTMPNLDDVHSDLIWVIKNNPNFSAPKGVIIPFNR